MDLSIRHFSSSLVGSERISPSFCFTDLSRGPGMRLGMAYEGRAKMTCPGLDDQE